MRATNQTEENVTCSIEPKVKTSNHLERGKTPMNTKVNIGLSLASDWSRERRRFSKPIIEQRKLTEINRKLLCTRR